MLEFSIKAETAKELVDQLIALMSSFGSRVRTQSDRPTLAERLTDELPPLVEVPKNEPVVTPEPVATQEPVITQEQAEKNVEAAPVHQEPEQPTIEEVRAALRDLRDKKGAAAVKEILKAYNVDSLTDLKPEDYLGALARAKTEV